MLRYRDHAPKPNQIALFLCLGFALVLFIMAFCTATPAELLSGMGRVLTSRAVLFSDYFVIGGVGAAFFNAGLVMLMSIGLVYITRTPVSGGVMAALFLMPGFALFGKDAVNILPFFGGVALYCRWRSVPMRKHVIAALYSTTLTPVFSELAYGNSFQLPFILRLPIAIGAGLLIGFTIVPLAEHMLNSHRGYILFNYGFASGFIALLCVAVTRAAGGTILSAYDWMPGRPKAILIFLLSVCLGLMLLGFWFSGWRLRGLFKVFAITGCAPDNDTLKKLGVGYTMVNMGFIGLLSTLYIILIDGDFSGPTVGAIFTAIGFAASGVQPRNFVPVLLGVWLFSCFGAYPASAHAVQIAAIFGGVALAPVADEYGILSGVAAGLFHYALVNLTGSLTGGLNLYNNGFSAGIVAMILVTLLDTFAMTRSEFRQLIHAQWLEHGDEPEPPETKMKL